MNAPSEKPRFEIALALAGTLSAGAYTAGVLDFLIEALDAWHENGNAPHDVVLQAASGASGGAVCATLLAGMVRYPFSHRRLGDTALAQTGSGTANPLFEFWVNRIGLGNFLGHDDLDSDAQAMSILDATRLDTILKEVLGYGGERIRRKYIADPFRLRFTLTNLRGVPYLLAMKGGTGEGNAMTMHEDTMRFAVTGAGGFPGAAPWPIGDWRHESVMPYPPDGNDDKYAAWRKLAEAALASSAVPLLLRPRETLKEPSDYSGLPLVYPDGSTEPARIYGTTPDWGATPPSEYGFATVDGGLMYDVPLELARLALVGDDPLQRNQQSHTEPDRAVLMISPLVGGIAPGPSSASRVNLLNAPFRLLDAYKNSARGHPLDLLLANDPSVGRFLVAPTRGDNSKVSHGKAIASGALGGFGGYLAREFRAHDYYLGRRNCQRFLDQYFSLQETNHLFDGWSADLKNNYRLANGELPIIPLVDRLRPSPQGNARNEEPLPDWPRGKCDVEELLPLIANRADHLYGKLSSEVKLLSCIGMRLGWKFFGRSRLMGFVKEQFIKGLIAHKLR